MSEAEKPNPVEYIQHHLTNLQVGEGFWTFNLDTLIFGWLLAGFLVFLSWRVGRNLSLDNPRGAQNVLEAIQEFVESQIKSAFPVPNPLIGPLARTVLRWQLYATVAIALMAGVWAGMHGALSALLGGLVSWLAGLVFAVMVSGSKVKSAGATLRTLFRAEASKIVLIMLLLWLVLTTYREVVVVAFFVAFVISVLVSQMAILVRESRVD